MAAHTPPDDERLPWRRRPRRPLDPTDDVAFWFFALFTPAVVLVCGSTLLVVDGVTAAGVVVTVVGAAASALTASYLSRPVGRPDGDGWLANQAGHQRLVVGAGDRDRARADHAELPADQHVVDGEETHGYR